MNESNKTKVSAFTIIGLIMLVVGIIGVVVAISGNNQSDNYLNSLYSQVKQIDSKMESLKSNTIDPYKAKSSHTTNETQNYNSAVNEYNSLLNQRKALVNNYNSACNNAKNWFTTAIIISAIIMVFAIIFISMGTKKAAVSKNSVKKESSPSMANKAKVVKVETNDAFKDDSVTQYKMADTEPAWQEYVEEENGQEESFVQKTPLPGSDAAERLRQLKSLFEEGLILEDEYLEKRREILDKI